MANVDTIKIKIEGVELPTPSSYSVSLEDLDSGGSIRIITTGKLIRSRIRAEILKISLTYNLTDTPDILKILRMIKPTTFKVLLYLPNEGLNGTIEMYANQKQYNYKRVSTGIKADSFSFDLTEV